MAHKAKQPEYEYAFVNYHGKDWHRFHTKAYTHLLDHGAEVYERSRRIAGHEIFHYGHATVVMTQFMETNMCVGLEFIAARDALKIAKKFMNAVQARPERYVLLDGTELIYANVREPYRTGEKA